MVGDVECIHVLDFLRMLWANQIEPQTVKDGEGQADWKDLPHHRHPSTLAWHTAVLWPGIQQYSGLAYSSTLAWHTAVLWPAYCST